MKMIKNYLLYVLAITFAIALSVGFVSCGSDDDSDKAPETPTDIPVVVSPTSVSLLSDGGSSTTISISSTGSWTISEVPEWLHLTANSGQGNTQVTLTAKEENFDDVVRTATITISTSTSSTDFTVSQEPALAKNLQVTISDMTIMSDGFACNLSIPSSAKGYREAFFTENAVRTKTEKDIYNLLMDENEYSGSTDYTWSPIVDPNTTMYYCIAAYGNENKTDGSHKYGKMTMQKVTTPTKTIYADMYVTSSYTSSRWTATVQKYGTYGTRCQKYYYFAYEGSVASTIATFYNYTPYAFLALFEYKPTIASDPEHYAISDQSFYYNRNEQQFFFGVWGVDDTGKFSNEHTATYLDLSSSSNMSVKKKVVDSSKWNEPRQRESKMDIQKLINSGKIIAIE